MEQLLSFYPKNVEMKLINCVTQDLQITKQYDLKMPPQEFAKLKGNTCN